MRPIPYLALVASLALVPCACTSVGGAGQPEHAAPARSPTMDLGAFSVSLTVKDLAASRAFYEKLGFQVVAGAAAQHWLVLRNGTTNIGLFQGMFDKNILTFNPGWSQQATPLAQFTDVRELQRRLEQQGLRLLTRADETTQDPASFTLADPDGNQVLVDQHVPTGR